MRKFKLKLTTAIVLTLTAGVWVNRDDGQIDDATFIGGVRRGMFRLHPLGPRRMSTGCIVLNKADDFSRLRKYLLSVPRAVTKSGMRAYGVISVASLAPDSRSPTRSPMGVA